MTRVERLGLLAESAAFDVVIIGAGINGAALYDKLCRLGYRTLLIDKSDFSGGTSQSSGMMIWGGLLYLTNFELGYVAKLSADRDEVIHDKPQWVKPKMMRYVPAGALGRSKWWVYLGLWFYWLMSLGRRKIPKIENQFSERELLNEDQTQGSLCYEEAVLETSDARFVYRQIAPHQNAHQIALNYCTVLGSFNPKTKVWELDLQDQIGGQHYPIQSKMMVNCAGIWTDEVNTQFQIQSPVKHAFSKGVYLGFSRPNQHQTSVFFDLGENDDVITYVPWGEVSLWGPTETMVHDLSQAFDVSASDIDYLLNHYNQRFKQSATRADIVSVRCGVRPLAVAVHTKPHAGNPLELSRGNEVVIDAARPWISCYGGKITGASRMAALAASHVQKSIPSTAASSTPNDNWEADIPWISFPHFAYSVPSPRWCAEQEHCVTVADYLRRRTNISQWTARGGLGLHDENKEWIQQIALELAGGQTEQAQVLFDDYYQSILRDFDHVLATT